MSSCGEDVTMEDAIDVLDDTLLHELGFGLASEASEASVAYHSTQCAVDRAVHAIVSRLLGDEHAESFRETKDAASAALEVMKVYKGGPRESEAGVVPPGDVATLLAWFSSHNAALVARSHGGRRNFDGSLATAETYFFDSRLASLAELRGDGTASPPSDALGSFSACGAFESHRASQCVDVPLLVRKRMREFPVGNRDGLLLRNECDAGKVGVFNPLQMLQWMHEKMETTGTAAGVLRYYTASPGIGMVSPRSAHYDDDDARVALDTIHSGRTLEFNDFCKLMLFVLSAGAGGFGGFASPLDRGRVAENVRHVCERGSFLLFGSWIFYNRAILPRLMDKVRTTYFETMSDDLVADMLVKHVVVRVQATPKTEIRVSRRESIVRRLGESGIDWIERCTPHCGQQITLDVLEDSDFQSSWKRQPDCDVHKVKYGEIDAHFAFITHRRRVRSHALKMLSRLKPVAGKESFVDRLVEQYERGERAEAERNDGDFRERVKGFSFGTRYTAERLHVASRVLGRLRLVCRKWDEVLRPFCIRISFAPQSNPAFAQTKEEVRDSPALKGAPTHGVRIAGRSACAALHATRLFAALDESGTGDVRIRTQSFPANVLLAHYPFVRLQVEASGCTYAPEVGDRNRYRTDVDSENRVVKRDVLDYDRATFRFKFETPQEHSAGARSEGGGGRATLQSAHSMITSGMFCVHTDHTVNVHWKPSATSASVKHLTGAPMTPFRLKVVIGRTRDASDMVATDDTPFYVVSHKLKKRSREAGV